MHTCGGLAFARYLISYFGDSLTRTKSRLSMEKSSRGYVFPWHRVEQTLPTMLPDFLQAEMQYSCALPSDASRRRQSLLSFALRAEH